jgi:hypothetical protein
MVSAGLEALDRLDGRLDQGEAVVGRRDCSRARLLPWDIGDDEKDPVERQGVTDVHGRHQVPDMNRVERSAEYPEPLRHGINHDVGNGAGGWGPRLGKEAGVGAPAGDRASSHPLGMVRRWTSPCR